MSQQYLEGVSVVVNALNDEADIGGMLESISKSNPKQIIVVDGGSKDRTVEIAKKFTSEVYVTEPSIFYQHKFGIEKVKHEYMIVLECDHRYPENFIESMLSEFKQSDYFGMQATLVCRKEKMNFFEKGFSNYYHLHQLKKACVTLSVDREYLDHKNMFRTSI